MFFLAYHWGFCIIQFSTMSYFSEITSQQQKIFIKFQLKNYFSKTVFKTSTILRDGGGLSDKIHILCFANKWQYFPPIWDYARSIKYNQPQLIDIMATDQVTITRLIFRSSLDSIIYFLNRLVQSIARIDHQ